MAHKSYSFTLQVYYKQKDYWRFVWCVRYLCPHLARHVEQVFVNRVRISHLCSCAILNENAFVLQFSQLEPVLSSGMQCFGEGYKAERWLLHSLQSHILSAQLKPLLQHRANIQKYYNGTATSHPHISILLALWCYISEFVFCRWGLPVERATRVCHVPVFGGGGAE